MEPHAMRPGYWKFLQGLTGQRLVFDYQGILSNQLLFCAMVEIDIVNVKKR